MTRRLARPIEENGLLLDKESCQRVRARFSCVAG
jgi:hypothetical protein